MLFFSFSAPCFPKFFPGPVVLSCLRSIPVVERSTAVLSQHGAVVEVEVEVEFSDSKENSKEGAGQERKVAADDGYQVRVIYGTTKCNENPYFICTFISK